MKTRNLMLLFVFFGTSVWNISANCEYERKQLEKKANDPAAWKELQDCIQETAKQTKRLDAAIEKKKDEIRAQETKAKGYQNALRYDIKKKKDDARKNGDEAAYNNAVKEGEKLMKLEEQALVELERLQKEEARLQAELASLK
ncbi:hypothetical protein FACS189434_07120 [Bacteroidia bacterium]|nr:hypothetical protein FACS189434_07120 [Bacteroidia bacterium]